jgi:hypothetical protein
MWIICLPRYSRHTAFTLSVGINNCIGTCTNLNAQTAPDETVDYARPTCCCRKCL